MTPVEAVDEILDILNTAWITTGFKIFYENTRDERDTDDSPWAVAILRHVSGDQSTLGGDGNRNFTNQGILIVQIYTPTAKGLQESYRLASVVKDAFDGVSSPSGVWFRNARINEAGKDGQFTQTNVLINFRYDEIK
jgi:hypothetical protein